jgi:hypothetical protein
MLIACNGGRYMNHMIHATALHVRTSENESFFHSVVLWLPMWAAFSPAGYTHGVRCCALTYNEQHRYKILTTGRVEKQKYHPNGMLRRTQRRSRTNEWRLKAKERCFPAERVSRRVAKKRKKLAARRARRQRHVTHTCSRVCAACACSELRVLPTHRGGQSY